MGKVVEDAEKEVLVEVVKLAQKQGLKGWDGEWKDFLSVKDKQFGSSFFDPAKKPKEILVGFLNSLVPKYRKCLNKLIERNSDLHDIKKYMKYFSHLESPEQRLVRLTMEHPNYARHYSFPFYNEDWEIVRIGEVSEAMKSQDIVSIDCEMVLCSDGTEAVVKVCVVDRNLVVKLNEFVKPDKEIVDYRSHITGIFEKDLEKVTCSLKDVQKSLRSLLCNGTILAGHGLHNDLRALKLDHLRVIDTSYIYSYAGLPLATPSLNELCKAVLGFAVRKEGDSHDCLDDALGAMKLVLTRLQQGFDQPATIEFNLRDGDTTKLLLHKVPVDVPYQELLSLFSQKHDAVIESDLRIRGEFYSTFAIFKNPTDALEAFRDIEGLENKDTFGRSQKFVSLKLSAERTISIYVRTMTSDTSQINSCLTNYKAPQVESQDARRQEARDDSSNNPKRQKISLCLCDHAKENELLKQKLKEREDEIFELQKWLADFIGGYAEENNDNML